jgi:ornithine cyclodeaminase/alanine dehydrogenase-like protein (mu-crystallin family)
MHVSSIGGRAELDDEVIRRADRVVIDAKATFPEESPDVSDQVAKGILAWADIDEIHEVVGDLRPGRRSPDEITVLKTVGTAIQDALAAYELYKRARERKVGRDLGELFPPLTPAWLRS